MMCPKLMDGISCINTFTVRCLSREQRSYFQMLYAGTIQVIEELCMEGPYQTAYLLHAPCMKRVQSKYQECSESYQQSLQQLKQSYSSSVGKLCCSFQSYLDCSQRVVNNSCGLNTAAFTKRFLDRMAQPLVQQHCQGFSYDRNCDKMQTTTFDPSSANSEFTVFTDSASNLKIPMMLLYMPNVIFYLF